MSYRFYHMIGTAPDAIFKSLADPTRRALFERLSRDGEQTVRMLTDHSGVSQPAVSKHLRILGLAGLVQARHAGRETHYKAQPQALAPLVDWMSFYSQFWHNRFDKLEDLLERMDP
jgi:DNA-binding transcriptional ArsR family regulator